MRVQELIKLTNICIHLTDTAKDDKTKPWTSLKQICENVNLSTPIVSYRPYLCSCKTVIFCRATPKNKAQIVDFIKVNTGSFTLAIVDGANIIDTDNE